MGIYNVDIYTDMDETLTLTVNADSEMEAESIACTIVENGNAPCVGQIVVQCAAYPA